MKTYRSPLLFYFWLFKLNIFYQNFNIFSVTHVTYGRKRRVTEEIKIYDEISWQNNEDVEVKKGWKLIELNYPEFVVVKILISKEQINEYHRIHRILTKELCVK